jgi:hypothetical protein
MLLLEQEREGCGADPGFDLITASNEEKPPIETLPREVYGKFRNDQFTESIEHGPRE